ncbi:Thioredoxin-like fold containing protein [Parasponia andersonii]|uniref:Thioredoxin-like fold containing protein n=1 Tax=Parasponia andersonii TaxID=3476 RepID=A0A2P5AJH1_PARAD|nr:Thioredoxin-like fold containing protein [Parasponia andersonii]
MENANMMCEVDNEFTRVPRLLDFSSVNKSSLFDKTDNVTPGVFASCTSEEYQRFESFFLKFMTVAKEFFLPSERHRYGLVSERSMLSTLGIGESGSWLAVLHYAGCPSCLKIIKKEDDLSDVSQMDNSVVSELEGDGRALGPVLPADRPSILLFVDRASNSMETRSKSKKALHAFRDLAFNVQDSYQFGGQNSDKPGNLFQDYQASRSTPGPPRLKLSQTAQVMKLKDKMSSIMVVNEGKPVTWDKINSDLQGSSLHEILAHRQQKKEAKLSSLAKELGFQLLSDDIDIKLVNTLPSRTETESDPVSPRTEKEDLVSSDVDSDKDRSPHSRSITDKEPPVTSEVTDAQLKSHYDEGKKAYSELSKHLSVESEKFISGHKLDVDGGIKIVEASSLQVDKSEHQQLQFPGFKGSFFFSDGNYRLLQALTGGSKIPGLVIVDPSTEQRYVFAEENDVSYSLMADFVTRFLNGSLLPYRQSESVLQSQREAMQPPFVNVDFHEVDSIPRVTSNTFSELVLGFNQSDSNAWNKDVLVLFSNRWCGFCQRMELIVREVYRAMRGYISTFKSGSRNGKTMLYGSKYLHPVVTAVYSVDFLCITDKLKDVELKLPLIYLLDCILNDCSWILRTINQTEVYPALILFPAEKKNAISYEGHVGVADVIKFIADHGSQSQHLIREKGILWSIPKKDARNQISIGTASSSNFHVEAAAKERFHEVLLTNQTRKKVAEHSKLTSQTSKGLHAAALQVVVGSILIATDKLDNAEPFGKSKILIVKANQSTGFQGLIINKYIRWDALNELEDRLQMLTEAPLCFGGPLILRGMPLVALTHRAREDQYPEVLPGVYYLDQLATYNKIVEFRSGNHSIADYWFFLGYSSWGWDQLFDEIAEGAWNTSNDCMTYFRWP